MKLNNFTCAPEDAAKLHEASVEILEKKGVELHNEKALEILKAHGARVEGKIACLSGEMVARAFETTPSKFTIRGRDRRYDFEIGSGRTCYCVPNGPVFIKKGNEYYSSTSRDVIDFIKLAETSPTINMLSPWITTANDVPEEKQLAYQLAVMLKYSAKPVMGLTAGYEKSKFSIELIRDLYEDRDSYVALGLISPMSPLVYDDRMLEAIIAYAEENQPLFFSSAVLPGVTGPVTMAGAIALANAEVLAGIVLSQLVRPGVPVIYGNAGGSADLRYVVPSIGTPEAALVAIYTRGLAAKYGVPCRAGGALSDAKKCDMQAGLEATLVMLSSVLSGQDFVLHGAGILDSYNIISYDKFLMDEEMTLMCERIRGGVSVDADSLALDVINKVDHGAQFLMEKHTVKNMKKSLHTPRFMERGFYPNWHKTGEPSASDNALRAVENRLAGYQHPEMNDRQAGLLQPYLDL